MRDLNCSGAPVVEVLVYFISLFSSREKTVWIIVFLFVHVI